MNFDSGGTSIQDAIQPIEGDTFDATREDMYALLISSDIYIHMTSDQISSKTLPTSIGFIQNLNESSRKNTFWSTATTESYTELSHTTSGTSVSTAISDSSGTTHTIDSNNPSED